MRRTLAVFLFIALAGSAALAQFTTVTGTITDPNSVPYSNGTITAQLVTTGTTPTLNGLPFSMSGSSGLDTNGKFTMRLADNTQIVPGTLQWKFIVTCGGGCVPPANGTGPQQFSVSITISGASQDISATLSAAAPALTRSAGGGSPAFSAVTAGTNTNALVVGAGGSLTPNQGTIPNPFGQIAGTGDWYPIAPTLTIPPAPSLTVNASGGVYTNGEVLRVRITYVGLATIQPSGEVGTGLPGGMTGCTGGNQCSVTVNMPTPCTGGNLPTGATGCSVWFSTGAGANFEQLFSGCTNITAATCSLTAEPAGGAFIATVMQTTAGITPPNAQTAGIPNHTIPFSWIQKSDLKYYPLWGLNTIALNSSQPQDVLEVFQRIFFNDTQQLAEQGIASSGNLGLSHMMGFNLNPSCSATNLCINTAMSAVNKDSAATNTTWEQNITFYAENQTTNNNFVCSPVSSEVCAGVFRGSMNDTRTGGNVTGTGSGFAAISGFSQNSMGASHGTGPNQYVGGSFLAQDGTQSAYNEGGQQYVGVSAQATDVGVGTNSIGYNFKSIKGANFGNGNVGYFATAFTPARNIDYALFLDGGNVYFGGQAEAPVYLDSIITNHASIAVTGSIADTGDYTTTGLAPAATIGPVGNGGTSGATTYTYNAACVGASGTVSVYTTPRSTTTGNANLTATNFNSIITGAMPNGCTSINIYRTAAGGTCNGGACGTGWIGNVVMPEGVNIASLAPNLSPFISFNDTGIVASGGATPPAGNTNNTGALLTSGLVNGTNTSRVASNFTTTNAALTLITGLITPHLYNSAAQSYTLLCWVQYSVSANSAVAFGVQATLNNPTNIAASGDMQITSGSPSAYVSGPGIQTLATTTATSIVSGTPTSAANQIYRALFQITLENPANTDNQLQLMADIAAGNTLTVYRGGSCSVQP